MLTYQYIASTRSLAKASLLVVFRPVQNPEKSKQTGGDFPDFIVRQCLAELFLVNGFELLDGLAAQLLWCFHATHLTGASLSDKGGQSCQRWQVWTPQSYSSQ